MNNIDLANGLVFQALRVRKDTFDERLISQKKVFLLQEFGINLGYSYNWYIRGPYSPDLISYIYNKLDILSNYDFSDYSLSEKAREQVEKVNKLADDCPKTLSQASWYELLASLLYIAKKWKSEDLTSILIKQKPQYTEEECRAAITALKYYHELTNRGQEPYKEG